jgi:uroporphyrinogen decarboxylase
MDDASGRYLPEFIALRDKYDSLVVKLQNWLPITVNSFRIAPDAAILFSDILVIPQAMELKY